MKTSPLFPALDQYITGLSEEFDQISPERKADLERLAAFMVTSIQKDQTAKAIVICTHNSRRSHMGQLWIAAAAAHFGIGKVMTYSGGTAATAFFPGAIAALERAGFQFKTLKPGDNPHYEAHLGPDLTVGPLFSKTFDDSFNPSQGFAALMVCSEADEGCPFVPGASVRISLPFVDPKHADGTAEAADAYDLACRKIARAFTYAASKAATDLLVH